MQKNKKRRIPLLTAFLVMATGVFSGVSYAYLSTSLDGIQNVITTGTIQIALTEDAWDPQENKAVVPGQAFSKNPVIQNTGKNAAHVFLEVSIPIRTIATVAEDYRRTGRMPNELFTFSADEQWHLVEAYQTDEEAIYIYGYENILYPQQETTALFQELIMCNYLEGEVSSTDIMQVDIQAKAIQTGVNTVGGSLEEIYTALLGQLDADQDTKSFRMEG